MVERTATVQIRSAEDMVLARHQVRSAAIAAGFSLVEQTKIVTAASELVRNCLVHGGGGSITIEQVSRDARRGVRLTVCDSGPGIADINMALQDGYSTGRGLGYGLGGAKRLVDEFAIESEVGRGTVVTATRWSTQ
ncbi:anti-sigma regulatory factor [Carbonactinospora thermoautotrophica]|uniref:anti-sigma regulatory factor n=1 Tax=Carbonactinospora thermoautotrophica TaxID=1469144 RepID=UPI001E4EC14E|nr:anti-sigma regulatory factor [Carbonactinospora thermoautotrophica]